MLIKRILAIVLLTTGCLLTGWNYTLADSSLNKIPDDVNPSSSIAPPFISPAKDLFLVREGDSFVVTVTATCLLEDESDTQFELSPSTPSFVHLSAAYRNEIRQNDYVEGMGVALITPQIGDGGKYIVSILVKACSGRVERVVTFKVNVKPARPS